MLKSLSPLINIKLLFFLCFYFVCAGIHMCTECRFIYLYVYLYAYICIQYLLSSKNAVTSNLMWKWEGKTDLLIQIGREFCHNCMVRYKSPFRDSERKSNFYKTWRITQNCKIQLCRVRLHLGNTCQHDCKICKETQRSTDLSSTTGVTEWTASQKCHQCIMYKIDLYYISVSAMHDFLFLC